MVELWRRTFEPSRAATSLGLDAEGRLLAYFQADDPANSTIQAYDPSTGEPLAAFPAPFESMPQFSVKGDEVVVSGGPGSPTIHSKRCAGSGWTDLDVAGVQCYWPTCQFSIAPAGDRLAVRAFDRVLIVGLPANRIEQWIDASHPGNAPQSNVWRSDSRVAAVAWSSTGDLLVWLDTPNGFQSFAGAEVCTPTKPAMTLVEFSETFSLKWATSLSGGCTDLGDVPTGYLETTADGSISWYATVHGGAAWGAWQLGPSSPSASQVSQPPRESFLASADQDGRPAWAHTTRDATPSTGPSGLTVSLSANALVALGPDGLPLGPSTPLPFEVEHERSPILVTSDDRAFVAANGLRHSQLIAYQLER